MLLLIIYRDLRLLLSLLILKILKLGSVYFKLSFNRYFLGDLIRILSYCFGLYIYLLQI